MSSEKRIYNLKIERINNSELKLKSLPPLKSLPISVDLRSKCPPVYDQGSLGSCTAQSLAAAFEMQDGLTNSFTPSRLFIYYNERLLENTISEDSGALLSDGIKSLKMHGVCPESRWQYDISKFSIKPPADCYREALNHKALKCENIRQDVTSMKTSLANGFPFVVGIAIYSSFESQQVSNTGIVPLPNIKTEQMLGGHAVLCVGYNDNTQTWLMRNSWGTGWGISGYFTLPYVYLLDSSLSSDLWNISSVNKVPEPIPPEPKPIPPEPKPQPTPPQPTPTPPEPKPQPTPSQILQLKLQLDRLQAQINILESEISKFV